ncbi:MAG: hypothetical protein M3O15_11960 [Acidobacteriota bacterium]|nr:hypothetical protein [Acidobacteriota bacterium]
MISQQEFDAKRKQLLTDI